MATHDGLVHVAGIRQAHDDVPAGLLGKHLEGLGLFHLLGHPVGTVPVGHAQQQAVLIALQVPHLQVARRGHQRAVVVVHGVAQRVVVGVYLPARLQQLHLVGEAPLGEHADGLLVRRLRAAEGQVQVDDLLHPLLDLFHHLVGHQSLHSRAGLAYPSPFPGGRAGRGPEVTVVAPAQRVLDEQLRTGVEILRGLVEHEAQAAHVDTVAAALAGVEKLHVAVLEQAELQSLGGVVHFSRHDGVGQGDVVGKLMVDFQQRDSLGEALRDAIVFAAYL